MAIESHTHNPLDMPDETLGIRARGGAGVFPTARIIPRFFDLLPPRVAELSRRENALVHKVCIVMHTSDRVRRKRLLKKAGSYQVRSGSYQDIALAISQDQ